MRESTLFQLPGGKPGQLASRSVKLLVGVQALLVALVLTGVYLTTSQLRDIVLENTGVNAYTQIQTTQERLEQNFDLLQMHLRALYTDNPQALTSMNAMRSSLIALQSKLPFIRSISVTESDGLVLVSTQRANEQIRLDLDAFLPDVSPHTLGLLRFGGPWSGRDFATGKRLTSDSPGDQSDAGFFPVTMVLPGAVQWAVVVAINSDYFMNLAPEHQSVDDMAFRVFLDNGILLFSTSEFDRPGSRLLNVDHYNDIQQRHMGTSFWEDDQGGLQLSAFRVARVYPWFAQAQVSSEFILENWRKDTRQLWLVSGVTLGVMLLISGFLTHRVRRSLRLEEQHREHDQLAASVFLHSSDLVVIAGSEQNIIAVNPAYEKITGYSGQDVLGRKFWNILSEDDDVASAQEIAAYLQSQTSWQGEMTKRHKDGQQVTGLLQVNVIRNERGDIINYIAVFKDLSHLRESEAKVRKLSLAIEQSPSSIVMTTPDAEIEYTNPQFLRSSGYSADEVLGVNPRILQSGQTPQRTYEELWARISTGKVWHGEFINRRKDGTVYHERSSISPVLDDKGQLTGYLGVKHDITAEREAERNMRLAASVIANTAECVLICDAHEVIIEVNPAFTRLTGYSNEEVVGRHASLLEADGRNDEVLQGMYVTLDAEGMWQGEYWIKHKDGSMRVTSSSVSVLKESSGSVTHYVNIFSDITEAKQHQEVLKKQAHSDPLTGLANRVLLQKRMEQAITRAGDEDGCFAVCFLDLDGFKEINDTLGHNAGDDLLIIIAQRLKNVLSGNDTVARIGGDEFVILLNPIGGIEECKIVADRMLKAVAEPVGLGKNLAIVTGSIGITLYPLDNSDGERLLRHADRAMYQAKQKGHNRYEIWDKLTYSSDDLPDVTVSD